MPIILFRHGTTSKNLTGAVDDLDTPLDELGEEQARQVALKFRDYCHTHSITEIRPVTSGALRTDQTARLVLDAFRGDRVEIQPIEQDFRLGEIKFKDRSFPATAEAPGLFGRQIDYFGNEVPASDAAFTPWRTAFAERTKTQGTLAALDEQYKAIVRDRLDREISEITVLALFIHNTSSRRLIVEYTGQPIEDMERIVVGNCAMIELRGGKIVWHDEGVLTDRERRKAAERGR